MCKKRYYPTACSSRLSQQTAADLLSFKQELRIKLWQMIAANNEATLVDPYAKPPENVIPYLQNAAASESEQEDDIADIRPTLDEVLPLPAKPRRRAADLIAPPASSPEPLETMLVPQSSEAPAAEVQTSEPAQAQRESATEAREEQNEETEKPEKVLSKSEWRRQHRERKQYFNSLEVQIKNKNSVCYEILRFLDEYE